MSNAVPPTLFKARPPLSPTSSPIESLKLYQTPHTDDRTPQTPTSPPLMSVGTQNYASSFSTTHTSPIQTASQPAPFSSPPSSAAMSTQVSQQPTMTTTNSFPTPASSVSGQFTIANMTDDMEAAVKNAVLCSPKGSGASREEDNRLGFMDIEISSHRRTDHDRQSDAVETVEIFDEDAMDVDQKVTSASSETEPTLASLQQDIGTAFHLCRTCKVFPEMDPYLFSNPTFG